MKRVFDAVAVVCFTIGLIAIPYRASAQSATNDLNALAQRFRPYLKFSHDNGQDEPYRPCSWQWYVQHSSLWEQGPNVGFAFLPNETLNADPSSILTNGTFPGTGTPWYSDIRMSTNDYRLEVLLADDSFRGGEDWTNAMAGAGIYAHVEHVKDNPDLINIEYIMLYAFNKGLADWLGDVLDIIQGISQDQIVDHYGDMTSVSLVYDASCDQIIRAIYVQHGTVMLIYDLNSYANEPATALDGFPARKLSHLSQVCLYDSGYDISCDDVAGLNACDVCAASSLLLFGIPDAYDCGLCAVCGHHSFLQSVCSDSDGGPQVTFVQGPSDQQPEHIAVYIEWGTHEPWPAACGADQFVPNHNGQGPSFLPDRVTSLGTMDDMIQPTCTNAPFIFFNGKWGSDPAPAIMHDTWYYPLGRGIFPSNDVVTNLAIPPSRCVVPDPYHTWCWNWFFGNPIAPWPPSNGCAQASMPPPTTTTTLSGPMYVNGDITNVCGTTTIGFNVTVNSGAGSGALTYYRVYPVGWTPPVFVPAGGGFTLTPPYAAYQIDYYSVDSLGNREATKSLQLTLDFAPPVITCSPDLSVECTIPTDPTHTGMATATDNDDSAPQVTYADLVTPGPCAGIMTIHRTWTAADHCGNSAQCTQTIYVIDSTTPVIQCPANIIVDPTSVAGAAVNFAATATDNCDPAPVVNYSKQPGSTFAIGTTIVTCTATDCSGNGSSCQFTVTVRGPRAIGLDVLAQLQALRGTVTDKDCSHKLDETIAKFNEANTPAYWIDDTHPQPKTGDHVFDALKDGVNKLAELAKQCPALAPVVQRLIAREVLSARILVQIVLPGASGNDLRDALKELATGDSSTNAHDAIDHYKNAWKHALHL